MQLQTRTDIVTKQGLIEFESKQVKFTTEIGGSHFLLRILCGTA